MEYEDSSLVKRQRMGGKTPCTLLKSFRVAQTKTITRTLSLGGYVVVKLSSHDAGGVTRNDFIVAAKIDETGSRLNCTTFLLCYVRACTIYMVCLGLTGKRFKRFAKVNTVTPLH